VLAEAFLAALDARADLPDLDERLEERLDALVRRARAAWPRIAVDAAALVAHLARHAPADRLDDFLADVHIEDLALAWACVRRDAAAIRELETKYMSAIPRALAPLRAVALADETAQRLRDRFLVEGKLADYSGSGPLAAWVRAAAVRAAIDDLRAARRDAGDDELAALAAGAVEPELELARGRHAAQVQAALQRALDTLPARDRNLLRFSYVDGLTIDEIGAFYRIHRTTAGRWVARAREAIVAETRRLVRAELALTDSELDSLLRAVRSYLHITLKSVRY
jgi:RNA polymerase sigma-70 factor, ECF subfamily